MKVISITGGIGSGKSEVMKLLKEEFGAEIIVADEVAHRLMEPGRKGYRRVTEMFGASFLHADGSIDRKKLADLLFQDKAAVERMNQIIHPLAWEEIECTISRSDKNLVAVEAALFDEKHNAMFDEIWYVYADTEHRIKRLIENRGYTKEKCMEIMKNQATEAEFRKLADRVIDNNGSVEHIRTGLEELLKEE